MRMFVNITMGLLSWVTNLLRSFSRWDPLGNRPVVDEKSRRPADNLVGNTVLGNNIKATSRKRTPTSTINCTPLPRTHLRFLTTYIITLKNVCHPPSESAQ